ncbi:hypothetical protein [Lentibacillus saliphilus]|uniref:hypothetical protein n=1 Tax=Lentibacillus saliphilus TaxID=2737028 RepID=UPI001C307A77|nr:hypothetical protein [Lentibacillus saliphilus]
MKALKFELKKIWRQKKLLWLLLIIVLPTVYLYQYHVPQPAEYAQSLKSKTESYQSQVARVDQELDIKKFSDQLDEQGLNHSKLIKDVRAALSEWVLEINQENWMAVPKKEAAFLEALTTFKEAGGVLPELGGKELDVERQKNAWMLVHDLPYEDEQHPISPHLFMKEAGSWLFGLAGVVVLLLFFGHTLVVEKEQHTWLTLRTQPIQVSKHMIAKFTSLLMVLSVYVGLVIGLSLLVSKLFGAGALYTAYPHVLSSGTDIYIMTSLEHVVRTMVLFVGVGMFVFALNILAATWIKHVFTSFLIVFSILGVGLFVTDFFPVLQSPVNPFQHLRFTDVLAGIPQETDWLYPAFALVWSVVLVSLAIVLPESERTLLGGRVFKPPFRSGHTRRSNGSMISNVFVFEWRKLLRCGQFFRVLAVLCLAIIMSYALISYEAETKARTYMASLEAYLNAIELEIKDIEELIGSSGKQPDGKNEQVDRTPEQWMTALKTIMMLGEKALDSYNSGNTKPLADYQLFHNNMLDNSKGPILFGFESYGRFGIEASIAEKEWLVKHDIQPLLPGDFMTNIHEQWQENDPLEQVKREKFKEENTKVSDSGLYSLYMFFERYGYLLPIVLLLFLLGAGFAGEQGKKRPLHYVQTQPVTDHAILYGKIIHVVLIITSVIAGLGLLIVLIGTLFNRFGDWLYPILHYDTRQASTAPGYEGTLTEFGNYGFHFISLGDFILRELLLLYLLTVLVVIVSIVVSVFFKRIFNVFLMTVLIFVGGFVLTQTLLEGFTYLSPFTYVDINRVVNGEIATQLDQPLVHWMVGSAVLLIATVCVMIIGHIGLKYKKRG